MTDRQSTTPLQRKPHRREGGRMEEESSTGTAMLVGTILLILFAAGYWTVYAIYASGIIK